MVFPSKIDTWLLILILLAVGISAAACISILSRPLNATGLATLGISATLGAAFPLWLLLSTNYTVAGDILRIRSGPFRWTVPLESIHSIEPTRNPLSSPALSLDRLAIRYGDGKLIMVSPKDPGAFINATGVDQR